MAALVGLLALVAVLASLFVAWPAQAQEGGNRAERVRIPFPRDDGTLTPYTFELGYPLMTLVYDTLMWRDPSGSPQEWLARRIRKREGGRQIRILLRDRARWHDGRKVTADDVAFTFDYFRSHYHPRFTPQIEGVVESVTVLDEKNLAINLSHPSPGFEDQPLSDVPILPKHLWEVLPPGQTAPAGLPVGSGPYRLVAHKPGKSYRFRAVQKYFLGRPRVKTIEMPFISDFDRTVRELLSRDIDVIPATLPERTEQQVRRAAFKIEFGTLYSGTVLMFNLRKPPFDSARARRAVARALDLQRIARDTLGPDPLSFAADRGYAHPRSGFASGGALHRFEKDTARRELQALDLPPIRVLAPDNDPVRKEAGRQVELALRRVGADASVKEVPPGELAAAVGQDAAEPTFEAAIWSSPPLASYSPEYLRSVFGSDEQLAPLNYSGYRSGKFDQLAEKVASETNPNERSQRIREELELLDKDAPVVPLFYPKGAFVFRNRIYDGWVYVEGTGILDKRSFLPREISTVRRTSGASGSSEGGIGVLGVVALGLLAVVLVVVALGLVGRVRGG